MKRRMPRFAAALAALALSAGGTAIRADFLDLDTVVPGTDGSFTGTLDGIPVAGAISVPATSGNFLIAPTGTGFESSTTDNSSPQYSDASVYTPAIPLTDRVGYTSLTGTINTATIVIAFGAPVTNPIFQVANLDSMQYDFTSTPGLGGLVLLRGNGGGGDGLQVVGNVIRDADPTTVIGLPPTTAPPTSGPRSAYGSVQITGTFQVLFFTVSNPNANGDGGSFTLSTSPVPEPASLTTLGVGVLGLAGYGWRRRRARAIA